MPVKERVIQVVTENRNKLVNGLLIAGGAYLVYRVGKKIIANMNKSAAQSKADDSPSVRQAMTFRTAMNPSGISWLMSTDGTNEDLIFDTAKQVTNLDEVSSSYKDLYQSNLLDDLQRELSSEDYSKFLTLVSVNPKKVKKKGATAPVTFAQKSNLVVAKKEVTIRKSPDASNHGAFYEVFSNKNIIRVAKPGEFLGYATGNQHFDEVNNVKFIEVGFVVNGAKAPGSYKAMDKKKITYWVSSSSNYVEIFDYYKQMFDSYPTTLSATPWMKPLDFFEAAPRKDKSVKGLSIKPARLLSVAEVQILNERMQPIDTADRNMLLGVLEMTMKVGAEKYYKFITVQNRKRWANARNIKIIES
ncbi:MAG: hypothetical protein KGP35_06775 [Bacteroidetes bacterium]|nr:hypothetical protein [Bacteroidota bacterium]